MSSSKHPEERTSSAERTESAEGRGTVARRRALRPSRKERIPYTDALAEAVATGRLTDSLFATRLAEAERATSVEELDELVADLPFDPPPRPERAQRTEAAARGPRWRRFVPLVVAALIAGGAMYAIVVQGASAGSEDETPAAEAVAADADGPPEGWDPPAVARDLDAVPPLESTTLEAVIERARMAGFTRIEQVSLTPDRTTVTGMVTDESGEEVFRVLDLRPEDAGTLAEAQGGSGVYLDEDSDIRDVDVEGLIEEARSSADMTEDRDISRVLVYRGDGSPDDGNEDGILVEVVFAQGPSVTLRASDSTVL